MGARERLEFFEWSTRQLSGLRDRDLSLAEQCQGTDARQLDRKIDGTQLSNEVVVKVQRQSSQMSKLAHIPMTSNTSSRNDLGLTWSWEFCGSAGAERG